MQGSGFLERGQFVMEAHKNTVCHFTQRNTFHNGPTGEFALILGVEAIIERVNRAEDRLIGNESGEFGNVCTVGSVQYHSLKCLACTGERACRIIVRVCDQVIDPEEGVSPGVNCGRPEPAQQQEAAQLGSMVPKLVSRPILRIGATHGPQDLNQLLGSGSLSFVECL